MGIIIILIIVKFEYSENANVFFDICHCVLTQHLARSESFQTFKVQKWLKSKNLKSYQVHFWG